MRKLAEQPPALAQNFAAGIDPFGAYSSEYGRKAQLAGVSEDEHRRNLAANILGGTVGGGLAVPAVISGGMGAARELGGAPGGIKGKALAAAKGFGEGAVKPFADLYHAGRLGRFVGQAAKADAPTAVTPEVFESLERLSSRVPVGEAVRQGKDIGQRAGEGAQRMYTEGKGLYEALRDNNYLEAARRAEQLGGGADPNLPVDIAEQIAMLGASGGSPVITPAMAQRARELAGRQVGTVAAPLALSAGIGATGAGIQYGAGREAAQDFQQRTAQDRIQGLAQWRRVRQAAVRDGAFL